MKVNNSEKRFIQRTKFVMSNFLKHIYICVKVYENKPFNFVIIDNDKRYVSTIMTTKRSYPTPFKIKLNSHPHFPFFLLLAVSFFKYM